MKPRLRVLFLCTGNSCRSQMAEGWTRHLKSSEIEAVSAGTNPSGIHPKTAAVMKEVGVDISRQRTTHVNSLAKQEFDYVITLCGEAREGCPAFPGRAKVLHRGFDDPASATGGEEEVLESFRKVRDELREFIESLPESLQETEEEQ